MICENYTQKKLKAFHALFLSIYALLAFVGPIVSSICLCNDNIAIAQKYKFPFILLVVVACSIIGGSKFLIKSLNKIPELNIDGSYNKFNFRLKLVLKFILSSIIPIGAIVLCILLKTILINKVGFIVEVLLWSFGFVLAGNVVNKFLIEPVEFELDIRKKLAEKNALDRRLNLK